MIQCTKCNLWLHFYLPSYQVQMYSITQIRYQHTCYQCVEVSKEIHAICKNFSEIDILKTENEELIEQLNTVKDENKQKEKQLALLMSEAEELKVQGQGFETLSMKSF